MNKGKEIDSTPEYADGFNPLLRPSRRGVLSATVVSFLAVEFATIGAQRALGAQEEPEATPSTDPLVGDWTYRSFVNNPDITANFNDLEFGRGKLVIDDAPVGSFNGRLSFSDTYQFKLSGTSSSGDPLTIRFEGVGDTAQSQGQIYDYVGYLVPIWPNGVDQVPAIVGSTVRTVEHDNGSAPAGVVASWIAMKSA